MWTQMPQQQNQALGHKTVFTHVASQGGGGWISAYDSSVANTALIANAYWGKPSATTHPPATFSDDDRHFATQTWENIIDFIEDQSDNPNNTNGGVFLRVIGNNGGLDRRIWVNRSGAEPVLTVVAI